MATKLWLGGATAVTQVDEFVLAGTWAATETITTTITAEDGSTTQTVVTTLTGTPSNEDARDQHLTDLQASTQSMFTAVTWTSSGTDTILGTAVVSGVPFYAAITETSGTGSITDNDGGSGNSVASAGPNDWNTASNWSASGVPVSNDDVKINSGAYDILYGLNQAGVSLGSLRIGPAFKGAVGDRSGGYYVIIDVDGTGDQRTVIDTGGKQVWINTTCPSVYVNKSVLTTDSVKFKGDITNLYILGGQVRGTIDIADSMTVGTAYILGSPGATVNFGESMPTITLIETDSGNISVGSAVTTIENAGATITHTAGAVATINHRGGRINYNGSGTLTSLRVYNGTFSLADSTAAAVTITAATVWSGTFIERGSTADITYTANIVQHGGSSMLKSGTTTDPET